MNNVKFFLITVFFAVITACGQQQKYLSYKVKEGETIKSIALDLGVKPKEILNLNPGLSKKPEENTTILVPNTRYDASLEIYKGKKTHIVQPKEGLYSISKKYDVSIDQIKQVNKLDTDALDVGMVLIIPEADILQEQPRDSTKVYHKVVKDDTVYSLTKQYEISQDSLFAMNPQLEDGLKLGMDLIVGENPQEEAPQEIIHEVKPDDTLYSLTKKYRIPLNKLYHLNPDLRGGLKEGMLLVVGYKEKEIFIAKTVFEDKITNKKLKVLYMLPYKLNHVNGVRSHLEKSSSLLNIVTDFHMGALLAIQELKASGASIQVDVFDTENEKWKLDQGIEQINNGEYDVVIGPLFMKNAEYVASKVGVPVIAPLYSKKQGGLQQNNLVKVSPDKDAYVDRILEYTKRVYAGEKMIVIGGDHELTAKKIERLVDSLQPLDKTNKITVITPEDGYIKKKKFIKAIDTVSKKNWVFMIDNDNTITADVVNNLGVMPIEKRDIRLFALSKGKEFDNVSNHHLERLQFTYTQEIYLDELEDIDFINSYKSKYYNYPTDFSVRGYDVTYDILMRLQRSKGFDSKGACNGVSERVGSIYDYSFKKDEGCVNTGVHLLQYKEGLIVEEIDVEYLTPEVAEEE